MPYMPTPFYTLLVGFMIFFSLHTPCSAATERDTLAAGQALAAGDKLISRNGKFAFGFFQFQPGPGIISKSLSTLDTNASSPSWYLGIWFNRIPVFTPVWVANRENPITDLQLKRAQLKITSDGSLVVIINNTSIESIIWSTQFVANRSIETTVTNNATTTVLMNNGNLVVESPSSRVPLWQSFDYPTDVGLPGAKLGWTKVNGFTLIRRFISKKNLVDAGLGSYYIELDIGGVIHLGRCKPPFVEYWSWSSGKLTDKLLTILTALLDMDPRTKGLFKAKYVKNNEEEYFTYTSLNESSSAFVSIDITGQIKLNVWSEPTQSWQTIYSEPSDVCSPYAACGSFTGCNGFSNPFCYCMESFSPRSPRDWDLGDHTGGCVRNTTLDCTARNKNTSSTDVFHPIARVTLPYDPRNIEHATTQSKCAELCLNDCSCTAYSYNNNSGCSVWHGELLDVKQNDGLDNTSEEVLYLRLAAKYLQSSRTKGQRRPSIGVFVIAASIISFGILMSLLLLFMSWRNKLKCFGGPLHNIRGNGDGLIAFRYTDICHATKNFSDKLGVGGFGSVFKGVLGDQTTIAVKRLDSARQGEKQFRAEVSSIGLIQHINLVTLIGFCCESDKRLLVYEHMSNGSLDSHLFESNDSILNWSTRYQIAIGVARGLCYLHQSCHECIIHCDIKPENILLGASFHPKIADFGMAVFVGRDFSRVLTTFRGTAGYLAPEWLSGVPITPKVDVYSFGMVLLEIISGRRNSPRVYASDNGHAAYFPVQATSKLHEGDVRSLVDPLLQGDFNSAEVERVCKVACWCIQEIEVHRPTMGEVVRCLEGLQELDMPPMPRLLAAITK